jgi:hypothetical protein
MKILTMYWDNIDPRLVQAQAAVFHHFGFEIVQEERTGMDHGDWISEKLIELGDDDTLLFVDIDCVPTRREAITEAFAAAAQGMLYGVAQVANHLDKDHIYASPVYLCLSKTTWRAMGCPDGKINKEPDAAGQRNDSAQRISRAAVAHGVPIRLVMPTCSIKPMWNLSHAGFYGIGCFYESGLFHLFQSRKKNKVRWFLEICDLIRSGQPLDMIAIYKRYTGWRTWFH